MHTHTHTRTHSDSQCSDIEFPCLPTDLEHQVHASKLPQVSGGEALRRSVLVSEAEVESFAQRVVGVVLHTHTHTHTG
jgi:ribosomal protein L19